MEAMQVATVIRYYQRSEPRLKNLSMPFGLRGNVSFQVTKAENSDSLEEVISNRRGNFKRLREFVQVSASGYHFNPLEKQNYAINLTQKKKIPTR